MMCAQHTPKVSVAIGVQQVPVDACIAGLVAALNAADIATLACCCGHGKRSGRVALADGREIEIHAFDTRRVLNWNDLTLAEEVTRLVTA